jgi:NAD(P)H-dependent FMN reductase
MRPEYSYSIPGRLKSAIGWASRPPEKPVNGKPIGTMGTSCVQYYLRPCCVFLNSW